MKSKGRLGHNPTPILSKGGAHTLCNEYIPDLDYELDMYYEYLIESQTDAGESPASDFIEKLLTYLFPPVTISIFTRGFNQ